jgi:hypothetical protein
MVSNWALAEKKQPRKTAQRMIFGMLPMIFGFFDLILKS